MGKTINICDSSIRAGEKVQQMVVVPGTEYQTPVTVINGVKPGKTLYISAGIHGGEYPGVAALARVAQQLKPEQLSGAVIFMHCVNYSGMLAMADAIVPEDGLNLNGNFPGNAQGTTGDKIAAWMAADILPQADLVIDLHSGGAYEGLTPCLFFPNGCGAEVREQSLAMTAVVDIPYCIASVSKAGSYGWAASLGKPALLLERGDGGECPIEQVEGYCADIHNLLLFAGIIQGEQIPRKTTQRVFEKTSYLGAERSGFWYPAITKDQRIKKGDLLGQLKDVFGNVLNTYYADHDGIVFYYASGMVVKGGWSNLVAYGNTEV